MPNHLLRDRHIIVNLPIVHLELEPDEVGQDRRAAGLRFDGARTLAGFRGDDGEAAIRDDQRVSDRLIDGGVGLSMGTMWEIRVAERGRGMGFVGWVCLSLET